MTRDAALWVAISTEARKFVRSRVVQAASGMLVGGIALLSASMLLAVRAGDRRMAAKLALLVDPGGWEGFLATSAQITATGGLIGFGVVLSWLIGREFADGTITSLFALPVSRAVIAAGKLIVYAAWVVATAIGLTGTLLLLGVLFGLGAPDATVLPWLARQSGVAALTGALAVPASLAATHGRGLLPGIATVIALIVVTQVVIVAGSGAWFPFAAPGLWAVAGESTGVASPSLAQLALVLPTSVVFAVLTLRAWARLELS